MTDKLGQDEQDSQDLLKLGQLPQQISEPMGTPFRVRGIRTPQRGVPTFPEVYFRQSL